MGKTGYTAKESARIRKAYHAGALAKQQGKPSNVPKGLDAEEKKAWRNGYNS